MSKILVVEDDINKCAQIRNFVEESFPLLEIHVAQSLQSGLKAAKDVGVRLVILDMTLPNYDQGPEEDGGIIHPLGGQEFLRKLKRLKRSVPVIVLTQFETFGTGLHHLDLDTLRSMLNSKYGDMCIETVYYNSAVDAWKRQLHMAIEGLEKAGRLL